MEPLHAGMLEKWTRGEWQARYCALYQEDGEDCFYVSRQGSPQQPIRCINLRGSELLTGAERGEPLRFEIRTKVGRLPLRAATETELASWLAALRSIGDGAPSTHGRRRATAFSQNDEAVQTLRQPGCMWHAAEKREAFQRDVEAVLEALPMKDQRSENCCKASALQLLQFIDIW